MPLEGIPVLSELLTAALALVTAVGLLGRRRWRLPLALVLAGMWSHGVIAGIAMVLQHDLDFSSPFGAITDAMLFPLVLAFAVTMAVHLWHKRALFHLGVPGGRAEMDPESHAEQDLAQGPGAGPTDGEQQGPAAEFTDTQQRILAAASRVFVRQGYAGASTRAIAAEAGVNEVTLFRNFGSKKALLLAVVERFSALPALGALTGRLTGDYRQDLTTIATIFMEMLGRNRRHILMMMAETQHDPDVREIVGRPPGCQRQILGQYLRRQMERGVVRDLPNPELVAQAFFGMFLEHHLAQLLLPAAEADAVPPEEVVAQLVDLFVRGTVR